MGGQYYNMGHPTVQGSAIYKEPMKSAANSGMFNTNELNLWNNCESILLETNFRQGEGAWTQMLNRIRVGEQTEEDIKILESRIIDLPKDLRDKAIHLFYTNIEVSEHNEYMLNSLEEMLEEIAANLLAPKGIEQKIQMD